MPAYKILDEDVIVMKPVSIRIKEVRVVATTPEKLLQNIRDHLLVNYSEDSKLMTGFYRETIKQDEEYINVSEAVVEILKAPYSNPTRSDLVRIIKGRRSPDVKPFQWLNFKLQGGPFTITRLDIVKTVESFIDKEYPYDCEAYVMSEETLNKYREEYKKIIGQWINYKTNPEVIYEPRIL